MAETIEIDYRPIKKIVILEYVKYPSIEELSEAVATLIRMGTPAALNWAEGVAFSHHVLEPDTEDLMKDRLKGIVYLANVTYALMPHYRKTIKVDTLDIPMINVTPNPTLCHVAKWLKERTEK